MSGERPDDEPSRLEALRRNIAELEARVAELRRAEAACQSALKRFSNILDIAPDAVVSTDEEQRIILFNQGAERIFGWSAGEVIGRPLDVLLPERFVEAHRKHIRDFASEPEAARPMGAGRQVTGRRKDGSEFPAECNVSKLTQDGRTVFTAILHDVTERKRAEETLQKFSLAVEQSADAIVITDKDGVIEYVNRAFEEHSGYARQEAIGKTPRILKSGKHGPEFYKTLWATILAGRPFRAEFVNRKKSGELYVEDRTITPLTDSRGAITHFVGIGRDVTERKKLEEQLFQLQKMDAIGRLTGGVAHDFNNYITEIAGYSELAIRALPPGSPAGNDLQEILRTSQRAAGLTRQLLAFSRRQVIEPRILNLNDLILEMDKMIRRLIGENIELRALRASEPGLVRADPNQIEQVIMNLVLNARDAMPRGGRCTIEISSIGLGADYAEMHPGVLPGEYVLLSVSDTGMGMSEEVKAHLFEPFFTTKEKGKGTGLGLATCYGIVKQAGGHITAYSEAGKGTTLKVYLPRVEGEAAPSPRSEKGGKPGALPRGTETILVVEDEAGLRELARRILQVQGYKVLLASDAEAALRLAEARPSGKVHLLLTDVVLPKMGGKELAERLRFFWPGLKVLFTSGYTENMIVHYGVLETGISFLQKPFTAETLARRVREVLDK